MAEEVDLGLAASLAPAEAVSYLRRKGLGVSWDWHEMWEVAHARAFTVAKAMRLDVLSTIREAVDAALANGQTRREFARELEPRLRALGWWGRQVAIGPDGEEEVQLGSPRRLKTIYDTNMRTAHNAARFRRQDANTEGRPYWMYDAVNDGKTRPAHAAMDRRVFRSDDPIWHTHYPPNGWNCRCRVRALTRGQVERMRLDVFDTRRGDGVLAPEENPPAVGVNRKTGEEIHRPGTSYTFDAGGGEITLTPDPGWSYNPGRAGAPFGPITRDPTRMWPVIGGQTTAADLGLAPLPAVPRGLPRRPPTSSVAEAEARIRAAIGATGGRVLSLDDDRRQMELATVPTPVGEVVLTGDFVRHVARREGERDRFADYILPTLGDPAEVWLAATEDNGRVRYVLRYLREGSLVVAQEHRAGAVGWTFYPARQLEGQRAGYLLWTRD